MTLNCHKSEFWRNLAWFRIFGRQQQLKMKIDPYWLRRNCSPPNVLFSDVYITLILLVVPPLGLQSEQSRRKWRFSTYFRDNISQAVSDTATVTTNHQYGKSQFVCCVNQKAGRFAPSSIRPLDVSPTRRFLVTLYSLSFIVVKLRLTAFVKANDDADPAYSVKTQALGANRLEGRNVQGRTDEGAKRP